MKLIDNIWKRWRGRGGRGVVGAYKEADDANADADADAWNGELC